MWTAPRTRPQRQRQPPVLPGGLPVVGHALALARNPVALLLRGCQRYGEIFSLRLLGRQATVLTGPAANAAFFRAPDEQLSAREAYRFTVPIFGQGIAYDAAPEVMQAQLALLFPALREERLQAYTQAMVEEASAYVDSWGEAGEVDLLTVTNELTVFIASRCLIGQEFRQRLSAEFARLYHDLEGGINLLAFFWPYLPLPSFKRRDRARRRMVQMIAAIIAERHAQGRVGEDFLQTLMSARQADGTPLSEAMITGLLLSIIFAGQHTSAVLAAWTGVLLLQHPQYLEAVLQEQQEVGGDGQPLSLQTIRRMVLLERAVQEAERLYPPLIMLMRQVVQDFEYAGYRLPAGSLAMVSPAVSHRLPEVFAHPERYDPERFAPGREEHRQAPYALIGFGGGRHACIGTTFAYLQVKVLWSVLLRRYVFEPPASAPQPDYRTFVVGPQPPCLVRYRRRDSVAPSPDRRAVDAPSPLARLSGG